MVYLLYLEPFALKLNTFGPGLSKILFAFWANVADEQFSDGCAEGSRMSCMSVVSGGSELTPFAEDPLSPGVLCSVIKFASSAIAAEVSVRASCSLSVGGLFVALQILTICFSHLCHLDHSVQVWLRHVVHLAKGIPLNLDLLYPSLSFLIGLLSLAVHSWADRPDLSYNSWRIILFLRLIAESSLNVNIL